MLDNGARPDWPPYNIEKVLSRLLIGAG
jgi:hypothetical protein